MTCVSRFPIALLAIALAACAAQSPRPDAVAAHATPADGSSPAPNDTLNALAWLQASVEARLLYVQAYRAATDRLDAALRDTAWDALPTNKRITPIGNLPPAVVMDVDETVLDNSPYSARLVRDGKPFDQASWSDWVHEEAARALPGALAFAQAAAGKGIRVIYITNRAQEFHDATVHNLRKLGFPVADSDALLGFGASVDGCEEHGSEKTCRRQLVGRKYRVLMQFGDQLGDFVGVVANTPAARSAAIQPYLGWIGERWFVLPNPVYGAWETALYNNDASQPASARRQQKIDALRVK